jgi:Na+/proline symporter
MLALHVLGLHVADLVVLAVYLLGITALGIWMARRVRNIGDFFMPRRFGKAMMITHAFGTGTHSDQAVSVASKTFSTGLSGIWYQWLWLFATPFYWLIAPLMRRFRAITTADVFEARYDRGVAMLFAVIGTFQLMFNIGVMLKGSGAVVTATTGGQVPETWAIGVMTVLFVAYGVAGGLGAAILTDFIQGILTVVFSFLLLPYILAAVGGLTGLHARIADAEMFSLVAPREIGLFYIVVIAFNALIGIVTQPHTMGNCAAGRTEMDGRVGFMGGTLIKRICTVAWCLTGLAAVAYFAGKDADPDEVYGLAASDFLPKILPGLLGVFLASLLASVMSSCDSFMIASSGLFTENVYRPVAQWLVRRYNWTRPPQEHYLTVGRVAALAVVGGGVYFAFWLPSVVKGLEIFWKIAPMMGIAFWLGLFWRRATVAGAWAATLTGFGILLLTTLSPVIGLVGRIPGAEAARLTFVKPASPSPLLAGSDLKDARALVRRIRGGGRLEAHLRAGLSEETRILLGQYDGTSSVPEELLKPLLADLNRMIEGEGPRGEGNDADGCLHEEERFAGIALSAETRRLLAKHGERALRGRKLAALNRRLLEEAFPDAVERSWLFHGAEIVDPAGLARRLREAADPVSAHVAGLLPREARDLIAKGDGADPDELRRVLAAGLNRVAAGESLYDPQRFGKDKLTTATLKQARKDNTGENLVKLNTYLLEEAFVWQITKNRKVEIYLPWEMVFYLTGGVAAGIVVSLLTRPVGRRKLESFYALARTPIQPDEKVEEPCTLPKAVRPAPRRCFTKEGSSLEIMVPTRTSVIGFLVGVALVVGIIAAFWWIARA